MKDIIRKILKPNLILGLIIFNFGMGLLIYVFGCHLENTLLSYIAYFLSAYSLVIFSLWFYKACKFSNDWFKDKSKLYKVYKNKHHIVIKYSLFFSMLINLGYGLLKLGSGIYYRSVWFITFAIYYLLLCFLKSFLFINIRKNTLGKNLVNEYKKLRYIGVILLFMDLILSGIVILIIYQNQNIVYPGYLIYIVAMYDFYFIITAFINVFKYRKQNSPILMAIKSINLTVAMIAMISLEVAMISQFGDNNDNFKLIMTSWTGFGVCVINSVMAIYMMVKAHKYLNNKENNKIDFKKMS